MTETKTDELDWIRPFAWGAYATLAKLPGGALDVR
jgi:hypothetical protein